ncbi:MAG: mechanosensitive ion channel [Azospirillaceae bacterium]|nr:mechanosensitive ion channel [Azospirillaceae bacterium]
MFSVAYLRRLFVLAAVIAALAAGLLPRTLLAAATTPAAPAAAAAETKAKPDSAKSDSDSQIQRLQGLLDTIEDPAQRQHLASQLRTMIEALQDHGDSDEQPLTPGEQVVQFLAQGIGDLSGQLLTIAVAFGDLPTLVEWSRRQIEDPPTRQRWEMTLGGVAISVAVGFAALRLVHFLLRRPRRALAQRRSSDMVMRVGVLVAYMLLELLPIVAFALVGYGGLSLGDPPRVSRLVALAVINATILIQLALALSRFVLSPWVPALRLFRFGDETAVYLYIWVRRLVYVATYGYFVADAARLLGLPASAEMVLLKLVGLLVAVMVMLLILQNRAPVAQWFRGNLRDNGDRDEDSVARVIDARSAALRSARHRIADLWHVLAAAYVIVIYGIWALNVKGGFSYMLRATALSVGILVAARLAVGALRHLIHRGFAVSPAIARRFPEIEARANRYVPLLFKLLRLAIGLFAVLSLFNVWGMHSYAWLDTPAGRRMTSAALSIVATVVLAILTWEVIGTLIEHYLSGVDQNGGRIQRGARVRTLLPLLRNAITIVLLTFVVLIVLSELGVDIAPLLAGAGVIGVAIGFGSQSLVKDVITGLFFLFEDTIAVGDVVDVGGGHSGVVEAISIRSIKLRDLAGGLHSVPFSAVATVRNMTKDYAFAVFDISIGYGEDVDTVIAALVTLGDELRADPQFRPLILDRLEVLGLDSFQDSAVLLKARFKTRPSQQWTIGREFNRRMKQRFADLGIDLSSAQRPYYIVDQRPGAGTGAALPPGTITSEGITAG